MVHIRGFVNAITIEYAFNLSLIRPHSCETIWCTGHYLISSGL